jgi:aminobenzoyl-glutamate transport protein
LDGVERLGNMLPDPVFIFIWIIVAVVIISVIGAAAGWSATNPVTGEVLVAKSLLTEENLQKLFVEMPKTYTGFTPLGLALTVMLGAGVAERSGLFSALLRASMRGVPASILTPTVMVIGMMTTHAVDAGYLVYIPLAGVIFAAAGS